MIKLFVSIFFCLAAGTMQAQLHPLMYAPEIALPNQHDSIIKLSSLQGKVVLIDFWASWCRPCRAANPTIRRLYKKYKDKGFEVYGISLDDKKADWLKAIKTDKLVHINVIDHDAWYSKIAESYFVDEIPMGFLLDKKGMIVAIDLDGKELEKKIVSLLK